MISLLQKKSLKFFHPILKRLAKIYLSKPRNYRFEELNIKVLPGVFHPGLFFSTKVFLEYLKSIELSGKRVLELGAGSGLISIYCSKKGAKVTASDINKEALRGIALNAQSNQVQVETILSDLFDEISPADFDYLLINPPYYPREPKNDEEKAWFCGDEFQYFHKLFDQLHQKETEHTSVLMILSEDCDIEHIMSIARGYHYSFEKILTREVVSEKNFIFRVERNRNMLDE